MTLEQLLPWLAGVLGVPLVNAIKNWLGLEGKAAVALTALVSLLIAAGALAISGGLSGENVLEFGAKVLATATLVYKLLA